MLKRGLRNLNLFEIVETLAPRKCPENDVFGDHACDPVRIVQFVTQVIGTNNRKGIYWIRSGNPVKRGIDVDIM